MGDRLRMGKGSRYVTSQLGRLSLPSLRGRLRRQMHGLYLSRINAWVAGNTVRSLKSTTRASPQYFCDEVGCRHGFGTANVSEDDMDDVSMICLKNRREAGQPESVEPDGLGQYTTSGRCDRK